MLHVGLCSLPSVMGRVLMVSSCGMRMMRRLFVGARLVVPRSLVVVPRRFLVVLRSVAVMGGGFLRHDGLLK